jgi:hypothetical protein
MLLYKGWAMDALGACRSSKIGCFLEERRFKKKPPIPYSYCFIARDDGVMFMAPMNTMITIWHVPLTMMNYLVKSFWQA